ncbi:hypothetical protein ACROYT_G015337 [Oculina patagonica]
MSDSDQTSVPSDQTKKILKHKFKRPFIFLQGRLKSVPQKSRLEDLQKSGRIQDIVFYRDSSARDIGKLIVASFPALLEIDLKREKMSAASNDFHSSKRRRVSDISAMASKVKQTASEMRLLWDTVACANVAQWFDVYSKANNTSRDILPTVVCLMGQTTIKVDCRLRPEQVNLFIICLSSPGSGKSPTFHNGCSQPVQLHIEEQKTRAYSSTSSPKLDYSSN